MENLLNVAKGTKRVVITIGDIAIVISWKRNYSFKVIRENNIIMEAKLK